MGNFFSVDSSPSIAGKYEEERFPSLPDLARARLHSSGLLPPGTFGSLCQLHMKPPEVYHLSTETEFQGYDHWGVAHSQMSAP